MSHDARPRAARESWPAKTRRLARLALGPALILVAPLVGLIPGPGGVIVLFAGVAVTLRNSRLAKRHYVRAKKRWPGLGHWSDKGLRRPSHFRRLRRKASAAVGEAGS